MNAPCKMRAAGTKSCNKTLRAQQLIVPPEIAHNLQHACRRFAAHECGNLPRQSFVGPFVRVQNQNPIARCLAEGEISGRRKIVHPLEIRDLGPEFPGDLYRVIR